MHKILREPRAKLHLRPKPTRPPDRAVRLNPCLSLTPDVYLCTDEHNNREPGSGSGGSPGPGKEKGIHPRE